MSPGVVCVESVGCESFGVFDPFPVEEVDVSGEGAFHECIDASGADDFVVDVVPDDLFAGEWLEFSPGGKGRG